MAKKQKKYKRLPGREKSAIFSRSLWMASDHLLYLTSWSVTQDYKRFFFEDILAITFKETNTGKIIGLGGGVAAAISILPAILAAGGWSIASWILFGLGMIIFLSYMIKGATCDFYIETAVQKERIYPVGRIAAAQKVIRIIQPLIEQVQAEPETETEDTGNEFPGEPEML